MAWTPLPIGIDNFEKLIQENIIMWIKPFLLKN